MADCEPRPPIMDETESESSEDQKDEKSVIEMLGFANPKQLQYYGQFTTKIIELLTTEILGNRYQA